MFAWGDIIKVDLSKGKVSITEIDKDLRLNYIGGRGLNSKILYNEVKPGVDPLSPENVLVFGSGPLCGTLAPSCGRWTVSAKSPLTGMLGDANAGGHFGAELKLAGHQHILIKGRADKPVYLHIEDDQVEIRDAKDIWGKNVLETQIIIAEEIGDPRVQAAAIGPAGENLVKFACIINGVTRAAGKTGMGAVMGSKNLKAISVRGTKGVKVANIQEFERVVDEIKDIIHGHPLYWRHERWGTTSLGRRLVEQGRFEKKHFQEPVTKEDWEKISEQEYEKFTYTRKACFRCEIGCRHMTIVRRGNYANLGEGTELTMQISFSTLVDNWSFPALLKLSEICNLYGLDFWSVGVVVAFLMELYQRGILTEKNTNGLKLEWGNIEEMLKLLEMITYRQGFGDIAAEGVLRAAKRIGGESEKYAMHIKGEELLISLRGFIGSALSYATSTRGADHLRGVPSAELYDHNLDYVRKIFGGDIRGLTDRTSYERKDESVIWQQHFNTIQDMLPICRFACEWQLSQGIYPEHLAKLLSAATDVDFDVETLFKCAERVWSIEVAFNAREGWTRDMDVLPRRSYEPIKSGPAKGLHIDPKKFEELKDKYYKRRGYDISTGIPAREKLEELGLKYVADELDKLNVYSKQESRVTFSE